jgi:hypothetical protein
MAMADSNSQLNFIPFSLANSSRGGYYIPYKHEHDKIQPELTIATQVELTNKIT